MDGKVLIVDDLVTNRIVYKVRLAAAFYQPIVAVNGEACLRLARTELPDIILIDMSLPDIPVDEVIRRLRADPVTRHISIVVLSQAYTPENRLLVLKAGADEVLPKPVDEQVLLARLRNLLRERADAGFETLDGGGGLGMTGLAEEAAAFEGPARICLIAEHPETALRWRRELQPRLPDQISILSRDDALASTGFADVSAADVYVIDADLGGVGGGLRLMSDLHSRGASRHAAMLLIGKHCTGNQEVMAYDLGANAVVPADVPGPELAQRLRSLLRRKRRHDRSRASVQNNLRLAMIDPLTGLYNRRFAMPQLAAIAEKALVEQSSFAVLVLDLDRFKSVNDRFGHAAGDDVLAEVARRMSLCLRADDLLARIGGEEFLVVLPRTNLPDALSAAQRLARSIDGHPIAIGAGPQLNVTVSIGVAISEGEVAPVPGVLVMDLVAEADAALRASKAAGRNQVSCARSAA